MTAPTLSADLIPLIGDPATNMLVVRLTQLGPGAAVEDGLELQTGPAWFLVIDILAGRAFARGETIAMPVKRVRDPDVRSRNPVNQWNNLSLDIGSTLIMACRPERQGENCNARAAIEVKSPNAEAVELVRKSYIIENALATEPGKVPALVASALARSPDLLFMYATDLLVRRNALGREQGAGLVAKALAHPALPADSRYELGTSVAMRGRFFDPARKADAANVAVIGAMSRSLATESDPARQLDWMRYLASLLLGELAPRQRDADALRVELVRSVKSPDPREMLRAFQGLQASAAATPQDKETGAQLAATWRKAFGIQ